MSHTIFVVDDDASFLAAIARLLRSNGFMTRTCSSAREFLALLDADTPGCVIADLQMPEMNGLDLQAALARKWNAMPIIFLTGQGDISSSVQAMRKGAEDYLEKRASKDRLIEAVHRAIARDATDREARAKARNIQSRFEKLTEREREVLKHVLRGEMNKQIAGELSICERTVKLHRTSITTKLGVHSVAEIAQLAHEAGTFP
jgi:FixJ family two-component response regulator